MTTSISQPNATLYIKNIDWKVKKPLLRRALYSLFSRHGKVIEIITLRKEGLRGQAFVIFNDVQSATAALQAEQGFSFFGKDMNIQYAKEKSDRIAKRDGTYVPRAKRQKAVATEDVTQLQQQQQDAANQESQLATSNNEANGEDGTGLPSSSSEPSEPPSHILLAQNLPDECNEMMLSMLFRQYAGFKEVRMPRPGLAFVEYQDEAHATLALKGLNGFNLTTNETLSLTYGKA